jgi:hypothetical protein
MVLVPFAMFVFSLRGFRSSQVIVWLVLFPLALVVLYMEQPFSLHVRTASSSAIRARYMLPYFLILHASAGFWLSRYRRLAAVGLGVIAIGTLLNIASWTHWWWLSVFVVASGLAVSAGARRLGFGLRFDNVLSPALKVIMFGMMLVGAICTVAGLDNFRERARSNPEYGYREDGDGSGSVIQYVRDNVSDSRILVLGTVEKFPLYGRQFSNTLFAPAEYDEQDTRIRVFGIGSVFLDVTDASTLNLIARNQIDFVVGYRPLIGRRGVNGEIFEFGVAPTERLRRLHPDRFEMVFSRNGAEVLKVRGPRTTVRPDRNEGHKGDGRDA